MISRIAVEKLSEISGKKVEIINLIFDEKSDVVDLKREEVDLSKLSGNDFLYYSFLFLNPGKYQCRMVIRNLNTGKAAKASSSVIIPETIDSGI